MFYMAGENETLMVLLHELSAITRLGIERDGFFAGTLLCGNSNTNIPAPSGPISISKGHRNSESLVDWAIHYPVQGVYWLVFSLPTGYNINPLDASLVQTTDTDEFGAWLGTLDQILKGCVQQEIMEPLKADDSRANIMAIKCVPGKVIQFPVRAFAHYIVETGGTNVGSMAKLILHRATRDPQNKQTQTVI